MEEEEERATATLYRGISAWTGRAKAAVQGTPPFLLVPDDTAPRPPDTCNTWE